MKKNFLLFLFSIFLTLGLIELSIRIFYIKKIDYDYRNTFLLFEEGEVFKNINNFFTYYPNKIIQASTYYYKDNEFINVNNYTIKTNNLGLVQGFDIDLDKRYRWA